MHTVEVKHKPVSQMPSMEPKGYSNLSKGMTNVQLKSQFELVA